MNPDFVLKFPREFLLGMYFFPPKSSPWIQNNPKFLSLGSLHVSPGIPGKMNPSAPQNPTNSSGNGVTDPGLVPKFGIQPRWDSRHSQNPCSHGRGAGTGICLLLSPRIAQKDGNQILGIVIPEKIPHPAFPTTLEAQKFGISTSPREIPA